MAKANGDSKLVTEDMLHEAVDAILSGMQKMFDESNARFEKLEKKVDDGFKETNERIGNLQEQVESLDEKVTANDKIVNGKIKVLKTILVSREEFEELREKVNKLEKSFASS